jgi:hypothetical protein
MNKEQTDKLNKFIRLLKEVKRQPGGIFDSGLIVLEPGSPTKEDEVLAGIKKTVAITEVKYDQSTTDEEVVEAMVEIFKNGEWLFLQIEKDIGSIMLNQLKHLANANSLQMLDFQGQEVFTMNLPSASRVIVCAGREFIERKISYPHFYTLFGPVLSLT